MVGDTLGKGTKGIYRCEGPKESTALIGPGARRGPQKNLGSCTCRKILDQNLEQKILDYFPRVRFCRKGSFNAAGGGLPGGGPGGSWLRREYGRIRLRCECC